MNMSINAVNQLNRLVHKHQANQVNVKSADFSEVLNRAIDSVNDAEKTAQHYEQLVAIGEVDNLHDAMIAAQKAEIVLNYALEIRNQVLEAYKELMRIQF
jgi:flagellar hook-basal body complex protein FliE